MEDIRGTLEFFFCGKQTSITPSGDVLDGIYGSDTCNGRIRHQTFTFYFERVDLRGRTEFSRNEQAVGSTGRVVKKRTELIFVS